MVRRLFPDPQAVEADHFRRTGIFPIMHVMILREETYYRHRWIAQSLYKALLDAKSVCMETIFKNDAIHSPLPWAGNHAAEIKQLMGTDFWPYGLAANHFAIDTFLRYAYEQGLTQHQLEAAELFAKETIDIFHI